VPEDVRLKVDAIIRRHQGMTKEELAKDPEFSELSQRFFAALGTPEAKARLEKVIEELKQTKGTEHGQLQVNFSADDSMDSPLGRSWLEAVVSDDPKSAQDWLINKLAGASFEFSADPTLDTSSEGVRVFPEKAKSDDKKPLKL
jgi:hypothetical protein